MIKKNFVFLILLIIVLILLFIFQVFPILNMVINNLFIGEGNFFESIRIIFSDEILIEAIINTVIIGVVVTFTVIFLALILAILLVKTDLPLANFFDKIFFVGYILPPFVIAMAWVILLNRNVGVINIFLREIFSLPKFSINIYSISGIIFVMIMFYFPFAYMIIKNALQRIDCSLEDAALISCNKGIKVIMGITIPQIYSTLISTGVAVFISSVSSYVIPIIIGKPSGINTITTKIFEFIQMDDISSRKQAMLLSIILVIISAIVFIVILIFSNKVSNTDKVFIGKNVVVKFGRYKYLIAFIVGLFCFITVIMPLIMMILTSISKKVGVSPRFNNLTFEYWINIISSNSIIKSIKNSLFLGILSALISVIISVVVAYICNRSDIKFRKLPEKIIMFSSVVPNIVIAISLIFTMTGNFGFNLYNTIWILCIAYIVKYMFMALRTILPIFLDVPLELEEMANISGAGKLRTIFDITLPIIKSGIIIAGFLVIVPSFYELTMSGLLYTSNTITVGVELYNYQVFFSQQMACALSSFIIIFIVIINLFISWVSKKYYSKG